MFRILLIFIIGTCFTWTQIPDEYRWLEDLYSKRSIRWVRLQNDITLKELKQSPKFEEMYHKALKILNSTGHIGRYSIHGKHLYNFYKKNNKLGVWRRTTLEKFKQQKDQYEILLDFNKLSRKEGKRWIYKSAIPLPPSYQRWLISMSSGGGDAAVTREFDIKNKKFVKDGFQLPKSKGLANWIDKNTLIISTDLGKGNVTHSSYPRLVKLWKRGTPLIDAKNLFACNYEDYGIWGIVIHNPERNYITLRKCFDFRNRNTFVLEKEMLVQLDIPDDSIFRGFFKNYLIIILNSDWTVTARNYTKGMLLAIDYDKFLRGSRNFEVLFESQERMHLESIHFTKNFLIANIQNNISSELYCYCFKNGKWEKNKLEIPRNGSIKVISNSQSDTVLFTYQTFVVPNTLYSYSPNKKINQIKQIPSFFDGEKFEVHQLEAISKDKTRVPYFLIHAKNKEFDGKNPTVIYGYGGFRHSLLPRYWAIMGSLWLQKGGVFVVANIRGGGEFGSKWHKAAIKENRQRSYDDFIAVAEDLIKRKITSPKHLGIYGGSNGGLLVGVAFTQRPDLFNAVVSVVPILDMKRYNKLFAGSSWIAEYGNPDKPEDWAYIRRYSPYHNLSLKKKYPKVFFLSSTSDDRVHAGHARKMTAKMKNMGHDVFYYENLEGGHIGASTYQQEAFRKALIFNYLWQRLK